MMAQWRRFVLSTARGLGCCAQLVSLVFMVFPTRVAAQECGGGTACPSACPPWCQPTVYDGVTCVLPCASCPPNPPCINCVTPREPCCRDADDCFEFVPTCETCNDTPRALTDLSDPSFRYEGTHALGLYVNSTSSPTIQRNSIPDVSPNNHKLAGLIESGRIAPRKADGTIDWDDPDAVIGVVSIGFSNPNLIFETFITNHIARVGADPRINRKLVFVNGAQGQKALCDWDAYDPNDPVNNPWAVLLDGTGVNSLAQGKKAGQTGTFAITRQQVQVLWCMNVHPNPEDLFCEVSCGPCDECELCAQGLCGANCDFPDWVYHNPDGEVENCKEVLKTARQVTPNVVFPNLRQAFLSSREYGGYSNSETSLECSPAPPPCCDTGGHEPYAYTNGFMVQELARLQIFETDPAKKLEFGPNKPFPFIAWGPYWWSPGTSVANPTNTYPYTTPANGLIWNCWEMCADGKHPSDDSVSCPKQSGKAKAAQMLFDFFMNDVLANEWFIHRPAMEISTPANGSIDRLEDFERILGVLVPQGHDELHIEFTEPVCDAITGGAVVIGSFTVTSTGGTAPTITNLVAVGTAEGACNDAFDLTFSDQIPPGHWTTVKASVKDVDGHLIRSDPLDRIDLGFLPGDADGNRVTNVADFQTLEDVVAGTGDPPNVLFHDMNRDENVNQGDVIREHQLLNGFDTTPPGWNNVSLPGRP